MDGFDSQDGKQGFPGKSGVPPDPSTIPNTQAPYPTTGPATAYPEESKAVLSLVISLFGLVLCGVLSPVGWSYGRQEIEAIDNGRRDPTKRDIATAGKFLGIIGTIFLALAILVLIGFVLLAIPGSVA